MWSSSQLHINGRSNDGYLGWSGKQSNNNKIPTLLENLRYFWNYQFKHMYIRYFMWNFSGKQNDKQGHGNILDGNWITGINLIDNYFLGLGPQKNLPKHLKQNAGHNKYYMLPFLLGFLGLVFQLSKRKKDFWAIFLLFFFYRNSNCYSIKSTSISTKRKRLCLRWILFCIFNLDRIRDICFFAIN